MNATIERLPERAKTLVLQVGDSLRDKVPSRALHWAEAGTTLGVVKRGTRVATKFARRNPTLLVAAAAGAGLLWYAAHRRGKQHADEAASSGTSTRIDAQRESSSTTRKRRGRTDGNQASATVSDN